MFVMAFRRHMLMILGAIVAWGAFLYGPVIYFALVYQLLVFCFTLMFGGYTVGQRDFAAFAVALAISVAIVFFKVAIGPMFKVLADVFLYIGSPAFRDRIQSELLSHITSSGSLLNKRIILVGHSLGTVVSIHHLLDNIELYSQASSICIVTLGSPLYRFFGRYFPAFTPHPSKLFDHFNAHLRHFRWVNVFKPFDPIGGGFGKRRGGIVDVNTMQWWRILIWAHVGYWSDRHVLGAIELGLRTHGVANDYHSRDELNQNSDVATMWFRSGLPAKSHHVAAVRACFGAAMIGLLCGFTEGAYLMPGAAHQSRVALQEAVDRDRVDAIGKVDCKRPVLISSEAPPPDECTIQYVTGNTVTPVGRVFLNGDWMRPKENVVHVRFMRHRPEIAYVEEEIDHPSVPDPVGGCLLAVVFAVVFGFSCVPFIACFIGEYVFES